MPINFTQTDTVGVCALGQYCAVDVSTPEARREASDGGTPGITTVSPSVAASAVDDNEIQFDCPVAADVNWNAGTWTVRLNSTVSAMAITWDTVYICRVSSGCVSQATIGSAVGLGISLNVVGVKSATVSGTAQTPAVGDRVMVILGFDNSGTMAVAFSFIPDQNIDSPFTPPAGAGPAAGLRTLALTGVGI